MFYSAWHTIRPSSVINLVLYISTFFENKLMTKLIWIKCFKQNELSREKPALVVKTKRHSQKLIAR